MQKNRSRQYYAFLEAWVSIIGNTVLFIIKIILGLITNSISLIADSAHTLSDVLTSAVVLIGFKVSGQPADEKHPFGHGRMESIATLIIAVLLLVVGFNFCYTSIKRFIHPPVVGGTVFVVLVMVVSAVLKEWMARLSFNLGKRIESSTLVADAWHHRSDAFASILVAIAIIAARFGYFRLDAIFGILVSLLILWVGFRLLRMSASYLIGEIPKIEFIEKVSRFALQVPGIKGVHDILVHNYGEKNIISLHIEVAKNLSLEEAHSLATTVENRIANSLDASVVAHVDLRQVPSKHKPADLERKLYQILSSLPEVLNYHAISLMSLENKDILFFHILVKREMTVGDSHLLYHKIESVLRKEWPGTEINIHIEPRTQQKEDV